ncbi:hypothetical protein BS78_02G373400 [Paspalum vaginatum]|nr:hypothetical protein BS78_02G373400 [Paspalum vaginatum]KAJ1292198.1 hypothetical protein BS78_02G373400 [Paspalum vaginatum]
MLFSYEISEPEQWDIAAPAPKKKLLVYFYGTKQIAFCSYADLEAFTEEKKISLLVKRHGRGADFIRAVKEIVEVYDSTKKDTSVNNSSCFDMEGPGDGSDLSHDKKTEDCPTSSMDHNMVSTQPIVNTMEGEHCVGDPIEKLPILNESRHSPLHASSYSEMKREDSQQQDSCAHGDFALARRSGSSLGTEIRTIQESGGLMNGTNLPSVDLIPGDKQEDYARHKCIEDGNHSPCSLSATKEAGLPLSSQGTCSQLVVSGTSNDCNSLSTTIDSVQCTFSNEVSQSVVRDKEVKLNGTVDLPMSTTRTFKRKRRQNISRANNPVSNEVKTMDGELQPKSNGDLVYSPNSRNEINKSDGDEHLPLVKRARARMEKTALENATVHELDHSYDKTKPTKYEDPCCKHAMSAISGKDQTADDLPPGEDDSPKISLPVVSGDVQNSCKNNKDHQPMVLTLDVEAALPPSKRLHRALEAMSANASETVSSLHEVTKSNQVTLKNCSASTERSPTSSSADALVKSPKSAMAKSPKVSLSLHCLNASTDQKHSTKTAMLNKDALSPFSSDLRNDVSDNAPKDKVCEESCMDSENVPDLVVHTCIDNNDCGKAQTCSTKLEEPAFVSKFDQLVSHNACGDEPMESIEGSSNGFSRTIGVSAEPVSQANAVMSYTSGTCDSVPHDDTVLVQSVVNVCDRTSASSLVSKVSCIRSDTSTRTFEAHSSSVIAAEGFDHRLNIKDKSLSPDSVPTKELIADECVHIFSQSNSFLESSLDSKFVSEPLVNIPSLKEGSSSWCSPSNHMIRSASDGFHIEQDNGNTLLDNLEPKGLNKLACRNEANSSRRAFEAFVGTLTRTKESISRATRLALDCAKHGIAGEVMDIIIEHLEKETNLYKRVDLFFLVDSIIRYCRNQKGGPGDAYPSLIQAVLPRIIYASAPPGTSAWENRRQCLKVLRLWLERKTLSEYIIRHHIKELEALNEASFGSSHRPSGTERALNDPLRDNEAFLVDEYGSNAGVNLPNLICTKLLEDEDGRSSEERSFEVLTPEHEITSASEQEASQLHATKHQLILEAVDGELEMEDTAPSSGAEANTSFHEHPTNNEICTGAAQHLNSVPPLPDDKAPSPPPLPSSPPPLPRPSCPVSQGSQVQGALPVAADCVEQHLPGANYNAKGQHPYSAAGNQGNMDACIASSQPPIPYNSGYAGHSNQMFQPPPPPLPPPPPHPVAAYHPSGPHGSLCGPSIPHHGNNFHQLPSAPLPNSAYHLQRPPHPPGPNQFPYPPELEQRAQPWNYGPSYPERYQYGAHDNDRGHHGYDRRPQFDDRGHHFDDRGRHFDGQGHYFDDGMHHYDDRWHHFHDRGQMHHEVMDGGRFPPFFPPGPPFPDHFEVPPNQFHCGRPLDPPPGPCSGWSMPHRRSKYPPDSRQSMEPPVSNGGGWRKHGRRDYDRYH